MEELIAFESEIHVESNDRTDSSNEKKEKEESIEKKWTLLLWEDLFEKFVAIFDNMEFLRKKVNVLDNWILIKNWWTKNFKLFGNWTNWIWIYINLFF